MWETFQELCPLTCLTKENMISVWICVWVCEYRKVYREISWQSITGVSWVGPTTQRKLNSVFQRPRTNPLFTWTHTHSCVMCQHVKLVCCCHRQHAAQPTKQRPNNNHPHLSVNQNLDFQTSVTDKAVNVNGLSETYWWCPRQYIVVFLQLRHMALLKWSLSSNKNQDIIPHRYIYS